MTMVAESKPKKAKGSVETLDNGAIVITEVELPSDEAFWQEQYPGEKVFLRELSTGTTIGLAAISEKRQPSFGFMRQNRKKQHIEQIMDMVEFIASDLALELLDPLEAEEVVEVFVEWSDWSKGLQGE